MSIKQRNQLKLKTKLKSMFQNCKLLSFFRSKLFVIEDLHHAVMIKASRDFETCVDFPASRE